MRLSLRVIDQKCEAYNSAVPIDKLYAEDLKSSGQVTFDKMLAYKIRPLIQSSQAISDATAILTRQIYVV
jgi:hypothetical protein